MKLNSTLFSINSFFAVVIFLPALLQSHQGLAQISLVCTNPTNMIYGLGGNGEIREINVTTGATGAVVKNTTYSGNSPSNANGLGYNFINGRFYYFKRNVTSSPQEFVSFNPATGTVTKLANSTCTNDVHTGCVNFAGTGYYTVDIDGNLNYYNIAANTWTLITSNISDQNNTDVDSVIRAQNAGDMAIDGYGAIWLVTSSNSNYALYKFAAPLPTTPVTSLKVACAIPATTATPGGKSFAGISFSPSGQIYIATKSGDALYRLNNNKTLTFIGTMNTSDIGNDLTSCNFPALVLPVTWNSFTATATKNDMVRLDWEAIEENVNGYYVQYSADGKDWDNLAFVTAKKNNAPSNSYAYTHVNTHNGTQYYRLMLVSPDDRTIFSPINTVLLNNSSQPVSLWPNPATDQLHIAGESSTSISLAQAQVFDLSGRILTTKKLQGSSATISISELPAGNYIVRIQDANGRFYNQKVSKQ